MTNIVFAKNVTLHDLEEKFHLSLNEEMAFFQEWRVNVPTMTSQEQQLLDKLKAGYLNLIKYPPMLEHAVQMAVLAPLLYLADFYLPPFHITAETAMSISNADEDITIEGNMDILVLKEHLWVMVIESKRASFSVEVGLAQLLAYILGSPNADQTNFGLITTGGSCLFVKLIAAQTPQYGLSRIFELRNPGNELYDVLSILKHFRQMFS